MKVISENKGQFTVTFLKKTFNKWWEDFQTVTMRTEKETIVEAFEFACEHGAIQDKQIFYKWEE